VAQAETLLSKKLGCFMQLSEPELGFLSQLQTDTIVVPRGKELLHEGQAGHAAYIIQDGWACSFKLLQDGGRQVITFPLPGDCVGLRSMLLRTSDHSFSTLTDAVVTRVEEQRFKQLFEDFPHLGAAILWATSRDEAMIVEHLVSIGRRSAIERMAHFFLELYDRLRLVGLSSKYEFTCPLNQYVLADALGLSAIHVSRTLRELREKELMTFKDHLITLHDIEGLKRLAGYEIHDDGVVVTRRRL
jgi:CRP-like cAMP-binding protein